MRVLVANAGSSSLKLSLLDGDDTELWGRELDAPRSVVEPAAVAQALAELPGRLRRSVIASCTAASASVPRSGSTPMCWRPARADRAGARCTSRSHLAAVEAVSLALPDVPEVACFDTAFHASLPPRRGHLRAPP